MVAKDTSTVGKLPEKYPKHVTEGPPMDYSNSAFPKPKKKPKKGRWGKR